MKNPWMSMWLSAANKAAGPMRGAAMAEVKKQQNAVVKAATQAMGFGGAKKATKRRSK